VNEGPLRYWLSVQDSVFEDDGDDDVVNVVDVDNRDDNVGVKMLM
jgi:hypothetical protein